MNFKEKAADGKIKNKSRKTAEDYGAGSIQILEGLEGVRRRPGMYIGDTGVRGYHHLVWEVLDNAVDEALAGFCDKIEITLEKNGAISISDNGRGIPTGMHKSKGMSALDVVFTVLHAGGKFDGKSYNFAGGLHGVGASVVNALSKWVKVTVKHGDGLVWRQRYNMGVPEFKAPESKRIKSGKRGTTVEFLPDADVFAAQKGFDLKRILRRCKEISYLMPELTFIVCDDRGEEPNSVTIHNPSGITGLIYAVAEGKENELLTPQSDEEEAERSSQEDNGGDGAFVTSKKKIFRIDFSGEDYRANIALAYTKSYKETILSFVNLIPTHEGGTHVSGFKTALTKAVNTTARKAGLLKDKVQNLTGPELQEGLLAVVSVSVKDPQFEGQTKGKLGNSDVETKVSALAYEKLTQFFEENPRELKAIVDKATLARKAREKARAAVELVRHGSKNNLAERLELPSKLASCISKDPEKCELFLVEGDSAGGSAKQARDRDYQAIMPLRGKILNCHKADLKRIAGNAEIKTMIQILGCGTKNNYDASKLRYGKIIFLTDADVDGSHIACLLITFFFNIIPQLLKEGHIYLAQPPLYRFQQGGAREEYLYTDDQLRSRMDKLRKDSARRGKDIKYHVQRYKGLGEMNPEQLWATTMDPEKRTLKRVSVEDWQKVAETIDLLMGDEVEPRRQFIMEHGHEVVGSLDI